MAPRPTLSDSQTLSDFPQKELLTRDEAAAYLRVKPCTLAAWVTNKKHRLPHVKVGSLVRYRRSDLDDFIKHRTVLPGMEE